MSGVSARIAHKRYGAGGPTVLQDLELNIESGSICAIVGPSGCGKTTLLQMLSGLDREFDGEVQVPGERAPGFVFQSPRLMPWLTALENIELVLSETSDSARTWLGAVGLEDKADALPRELSGGMQRRVGLARAFAVKPELLLLDEPFVSLDQPTADALRTLLLELWARERPTVVFVTHDLTEALTVSDRIVFLSSNPARIVHDMHITLPRPRSRNDAELNAMQIDLLDAHPELLSGRTGNGTKHE